MARHIRERIASLVVLVLSVAGIIHIQDLPSDAAIFPRLVLGLAVFLSAAWFGTTLLRSARGDTAPHPFFDNPRNLAVFIIAIAVYIAVIETLGYFTATAIFMVGSALLLGFRRYGFIGVATVLFIAFVYFIFIALFNRPLPIEFFQR
jgi:hypothetical protein